MSKRRERKAGTAPVAPATPGTPERASHTDVRQRAMLVTLTVNQWGAQVSDEQITEDVAQRNGMAVEMGNFQKKLLSKAALERLRSVAGKLRSTHNKFTLPWDDTGTGRRLLAAQAYPKYMAEMKALLAEYEQVFRDDLESPGPSGLSRYEEAIAEAKGLLNSAFRQEDYPTLAQLKAKFRARIQVDPVPAAADFRIDLGAAATDQIRAEIEERVKDRVSEAMDGVFKQLKALVERTVEALREPEERAKVRSIDDLIAELQKTDELAPERARQLLAEIEALKTANAPSAIRQDLFKSVEKFLDVLPLLNVTGDPHLEEFGNEIRQVIAGCDAKQLREQAAVREQTRDQVEEILDKMNEFFG